VKDIDKRLASAPRPATPAMEPPPAVVQAPPPARAHACSRTGCFPSECPRRSSQAPPPPAPIIPRNPLPRRRHRVVIQAGSRADRAGRTRAGLRAASCTKHRRRLRFQPPAPVVQTPPPPPPALPPLPPEAPATVATPQPARPVYVPPPPMVVTVDARTAYRTARDQYNRGDWISARKNFELAQQNGYKPGLFEDSPAKYLAPHGCQGAARCRARRQSGTSRRPRDAGAARAGRSEPRDGGSRLVQQAEGRPRPPTDSMKLWRFICEPPTSIRPTPPPPTAEMPWRRLSSAAGHRAVRTCSPSSRVRNDQQRAYINYTFQTAAGQGPAVDWRAENSRMHRVRSSVPAWRATSIQACLPTRNCTGSMRQSRTCSLKKTAPSKASVSPMRLHRDHRVEAALREQDQLRNEERIRTVADLTREARRLTDDGHYQEALGGAGSDSHARCQQRLRTGRSPAGV